jgi:hypothetical protein
MKLTIQLVFTNILLVGFCTKYEEVQHAIKSSEFYNQVLFEENSILCIPCQLTVSLKTTNHFGNVLRHFMSNLRNNRAKWILAENSDETFMFYLTHHSRLTHP